jgi:hypothetical protein
VIVDYEVERIDLEDIFVGDEEFFSLQKYMHNEFRRNSNHPMAKPTLRDLIFHLFMVSVTEEIINIHHKPKSDACKHMKARRGNESHLSLVETLNMQTFILGGREKIHQCLVLSDFNHVVEIHSPFLSEMSGVGRSWFWWRTSP